MLRCVRRRLPALLLAFLLLGPRAAEAQIVNTLRGFSDDEPGLSGSVEAWLDVSQGNTEYEEYGGALTLQWRAGAHRLRALGSGLYKSSRGEKAAEKATVHLRHNYWLNSRLATLAFVQDQYDPFQRLQRRFLVGAGLRLQLWKQPHLRVYAGMATMLEDEEIRDSPREGDTRHRMSSFLSAIWDLREGVALDAVGFYQPAWRDPADMRATLSARLQVDLVGSLGLSLSYELQHDARPPQGVESTDWGLRTGLGLEF